MSTRLGDLADQVRKIPMSQILIAYGLVGRKEGVSTMWRGEAKAINVTRDKWFDHKAGKGGIGAIDLVMHLDGQTFKEAVLSLWKAHHGSFEASTVPRAVAWTQERRPLADLMEQYAKRDSTSAHHRLRPGRLPLPKAQSTQFLTIPCIRK
jgi:hypothetical protein